MLSRPAAAVRAAVTALRFLGPRAVLAAAGLGLAAACAINAGAAENVAAAPAAVPSVSLTTWEFVQDAAFPPGETGEELADFRLTPAVFDGARLDLADLRLVDAGGREISYALRVRRPEDATDAVKAEVFNRTRGPDQTSQLALDLGETRIEHNEVEAQLPGGDFRRRALLEGSDDSAAWSKLAEQNLLRFTVGEKQLVDLTIDYSPSRFRYLRLTIWPDPQVDEEPVDIGQVVVRRRIELPGEFTVRESPFSPRQAVRGDGGPGSAWIIDLGGRDVPCSELRVEVADAEFVRDWHLEAGGPDGSRDDFRWIAAGTWRRRAGEPIEPLRAEFGEITAARLRLVVTDHRNPPLDTQRCLSVAAARAVIFPVARLAPGPVRLHFGNPEAEAPNYDFARNLPPQLAEPPVRLDLGPRLINPAYQPAPLPLTERWPWLIYALLGLAVAVLGLLILNLARAAFALSDIRGAEPQG